MASYRKRGDKWQARITRRGFPAEARTFTTKREAESWATHVESDIDRGAYVSRTEAEKTTLSDVLDRYMAEVSPTKRGGHEEIIRLKALQRHRISKLCMAALSPKAVAKYRDQRLESCSASTVIRDLAALSSVINHARREWSIAIPNPIAMIRKPPMPPGRNRVLSVCEETHLLEAVEPKRNRNPYMKPLVIIALETAMRRGELLALQWTDVDLSTRVAHLTMTKNGDSRLVPLSTRAVTTLASMIKSSDGRVFPVNSAAMEAIFHRARIRANLSDLHFHDLRHTAITRLVERVSNILELGAITGHRDLRMLKRYYHPKAEEIALKLR